MQKRILSLCVFALIAFAASATVFAQSSIMYRVHMANKGWQTGWSMNGEMSGTTGESRQVEALEVKLAGIKGASVRYEAFIDGTGWSSWKLNGATAGTTGAGKRLEAVKIELQKGAGFGVKYRAHVSGFGWTEWAENGKIAGTPASGKAIEAIEVALIPPPPKPAPKKK